MTREGCYATGLTPEGLAIGVRRVLAHMHEPACQCSRCRVARDYARLRAAGADGPVAEPAQPLAPQLGIPGEDAEGLDRDAVALNAHA